jgi:hypothetical protein
MPIMLRLLLLSLTSAGVPFNEVYGRQPWMVRVVQEQRLAAVGSMDDIDRSVRGSSSCSALPQRNSLIGSSSGRGPPELEPIFSTPASRHCRLQEPPATSRAGLSGFPTFQAEAVAPIAWLPWRRCSTSPVSGAIADGIAIDWVGDETGVAQVNVVIDQNASTGGFGDRSTV